MNKVRIMFVDGAMAVHMLTGDDFRSSTTIRWGQENEGQWYTAIARAIWHALEGKALLGRSGAPVISFDPMRKHWGEYTSWSAVYADRGSFGTLKRGRMWIDAVEAITEELGMPSADDNDLPL